MVDLGLQLGRAGTPQGASQAGGTYRSNFWPSGARSLPDPPGQRNGAGRRRCARPIPQHLQARQARRTDREGRQTSTCNWQRPRPRAGDESLLLPAWEASVGAAPARVRGTDTNATVKPCRSLMPARAGDRLGRAQMGPTNPPRAARRGPTLSNFGPIRARSLAPRAGDRHGTAPPRYTRAGPNVACTALSTGAQLPCTASILSAASSSCCAAWRACAGVKWTFSAITSM